MYAPHYLTLSRHQVYCFRFPIPSILNPEPIVSDTNIRDNKFYRWQKGNDYYFEKGKWTLTN